MLPEDRTFTIPAVDPPPGGLHIRPADLPRPESETRLTHKLRAVEVQTDALRTRSFTVDASVSNNFDQGALQRTGRAYDVALQGKGWLAVQMPDGSEAYTRNGSFEVSSEGLLVTHNGLPVFSDGSLI